MGTEAVGRRPLTGQVAVVTGAGRGIGRGIALALAARGADLALAGRTVSDLDDAAREASAVHGVRAIAIASDVTDPEQMGELAARTESELGGVDILVNNSGIMVEGAFLDVSQEQFDRVIETNLRGTVLCCRAIGARLTAQGHGKVINVASNLGLGAVTGAAAYCTSKAAVISLTRVLALEWARHGVQVNAIAPGYVETSMNDEVRADPALHRQVLGKIPARRFGRTDEVGALVAYLASSESDFITGQCVVIDGGQLARA